MVDSDGVSAIDTDDLRKARGAFFTPVELCDFVCEWAVRSSSDRVFEPSCGEAAFMLAAGERLRDLGTRKFSEHLFGVELHEESARLALKALDTENLTANVSIGDFFDVVAPGPFDAVVGNPPYVRYQDFTGSARDKSREVALRHGVRLTALSSSWASFVVHASQYLKPEGRLGLVLPAELLTVNYAAEVRAFLLRRFASVRLVVFENRVFPGVTEEVVLLLAEGHGGSDHFEVHRVSGLADLRDAAPHTTEWRPPTPLGKWSGALLQGDAAEVFARISESKHFEALSEWGDPDLGMVTGNNDYFTLTSEDVRRLRLPESELLPISPPGSRHLRGLTFTTARWQSMLRDGSRGYLFYPDARSPSKAAQAYIAEGEAAGVQTAYKCRVRKPWWRVPLTPIADLFFTYMNHDAPRLVANRAGVRHLNSIHGLVLKPGRRRLGMDVLRLAMLNSATLLSAELVGRSYGGGILKLEPKEAHVLAVPSEATVDSASDALRAVRQTVTRHLAEGRLGEAIAQVDSALLLGQLELDKRELAVLSGARTAMFVRRQARKS